MASFIVQNLKKMGIHSNQVEKSEITETTEITEKAVKQSNSIVYYSKTKK